MERDLANEAFKQIVRTIKNKIPVSKGIVRRTKETDQGFLSDIHNFILEDESLKFRLGTRVIADMGDELWYMIDSFKIAGTTVMLGLNYKRELWAWLPQWPESSFKVFNTSPFKTSYPHKTIAGVPYASGHFSFDRGNKFWIGEDNYSVVIINDYAEIFRIMKNGCFRITADDDYADQREAIQDARDDITLTTGRLYLDIKEATNKVFNERMYIGDESIRRSHRITGETRFAYVNELGVVSELSDPIDIEGYRHVVVSKIPIVKRFAPENIVQPQAVANTGCSIYENTSTGISEAATAGNLWNPANPSGTLIDAHAFIICVKNGTFTPHGGAAVEIPEGVYMCIQRITGGAALDRSLAEEEYNYNFVQHQFTDILASCVKKAAAPSFFKAVTRDVLFAPSDFDALPNVKRLEFVKVTVPNIGAICLPDDMTAMTGLFDSGDYIVFSNEASPAEGWIKLSDTFFPEIYGEREITISASGATPDVMTFVGSINQMELTINYDAAVGYTWNDSCIRGVEVNKAVFSSTFTMWQNLGFDCWKYLGMVDSITINDFVPETKKIEVAGIDLNADVFLSGTDTDIWQSIINSRERFAVWNSSHIQGISQRFFINDLLTKSIAYEGEVNTDVGSFNQRDSGVQYKIGFAPLMTLDYTGLRRIPMPLPMIRRAMRNPQFVSIAGGNVYVVEDNKIWVGSVNDFMMVDYIEIHSTVNHMASFGEGVIVSTKNGLFYCALGEGMKQVVGGETVLSKFLAPCSGGVLSVDERDVHIIYKRVTETGAWYPAVVKINDALSEINLEGEIKSVSIGKNIYVADDWNIWVYDMTNKVWAGKEYYNYKIHRLYVLNNKLGIAFEDGVNRRNAFERPRNDQA